jgi:hypothetical protein
MTLAARDRIKDLLAQGTLSGIDFVEILDDAETSFKVHFLTGTIPLQTNIISVSITGGETIPAVAVLPFAASDFGTDPFGKTTLTLRVAAPGDFSTYTLTIKSPKLDEYFDHVPFSFKALCPSDIDCEQSPDPCPVEDVDVPPIDYLAKDFQSFRRALSDFSALRYPAWQERSEADFGSMFMEALCAVADDLSYQQDRLAAQAYFDTATERRSIVRHARLVDYEPRPATASRVLLRFDAIAGPIPAGLPVHATGPDGAPIDFETGTGLDDTTDYDVRPEWNAMPAYYWDDSARCLHRGATELWLEGSSATLGLAKGQSLLLETPGGAGNPPLRQLVTIVTVSPDRDDVYGVDLTHVVFDEPVERDRDLQSTTAYANLVPATQGRRFSEGFAIESAPPGVALAVVRTGPNATSQYLYTLRNAPLAYLTTGDGSTAPEVRLTQTDVLNRWKWIRTLIDAAPFPEQPLYTVDPMRLSPVGLPDANLRRPLDYDGSDGASIRFGDGTFGDLPDPGATFVVDYRVGGGAVGNVAADSITVIDPNGLLSTRASAVTNPFAATGGADVEPDETVRRLAPEAFRAKQFRAVRPEDYARAAETLPWVERAGTTFRWTGSWLTVFTSAEPLETELPTDAETRELVALLNRYRMTGYESYVLPPRYASLDIEITVCARADAFRGDVESAVQKAVSSRPGGFFHHDRFVFGQALERSQLEACVQNAYGVDGVLDIRYRRRGMTAGMVEMPSRVLVAPSEIVRADGDPSRGDAGSVTVVVEGGK